MSIVDLPWECLYDPTQSHFLAYSTVTPLVRYHDLPNTVAPLAVQPPLKVLVMIANPRDHSYTSLNVDEEWRKVQGALAELEVRSGPGDPSGSRHPQRAATATAP